MPHGILAGTLREWIRDRAAVIVKCVGLMDRSTDAGWLISEFPLRLAGIRMTAHFQKADGPGRTAGESWGETG